MTSHSKKLGRRLAEIQRLLDGYQDTPSEARARIAELLIEHELPWLIEQMQRMPVRSKDEEE